LFPHARGLSSANDPHALGVARASTAASCFATMLSPYGMAGLFPPCVWSRAVGSRMPWPVSAARHIRLGGAPRRPD